jgi:hypothetical protein
MTGYTNYYAVALCLRDDCGWTWKPPVPITNRIRTAPNAQRAARKHADATGHRVRVDREQWQLVDPHDPHEH